MTVRFSKPLAVVAVLAGLAMAGAPAKAALLIRVQEDGGPVITIVDNQAVPVLDTNTELHAIDVNVAQLNALLTDFQFVTLGSASNVANQATGSGSTAAVLTRTGSVERVTTTGVRNITISTTETANITPTGDPKLLSGSASSTFTNTGDGDLRTFEGFGTPGSVEFGTGTSSGVLTFQDNTASFPGKNRSFAGDSADVPFNSGGVPYTLTTTTIIASNPAHVVDGATVFRRFQFGGSLTARGPAAVVPEPATMALALTALPLLGIGLLRRRNRKAQA